MASIKEYIQNFDASGLTPAPKVGRFELMRTIHKYPWFTTARIIRNRQNDNDDEFVYLAQLFPVSNTTCDEGELREAIENNVIDRFLSLGKYTIAHTEEDGGAVSLVDNSAQEQEDDDEFYTEELAQIYEQQGLFEEARKIYIKLSLLYPKKSVYFAEIISKIDKNINT
jgi:Flp pilus assembly protein TadD